MSSSSLRWHGACARLDVGTDSDATLMLRVQGGDREAFGDLIERHGDTVVNYLTRLTRDRGRAEELAQEAFLRLYEKSSHYEERGHLRSYLLRIATNLLRSEERRKTRWRTLRRLAASSAEPPPPSPQRRALSAEATRMVDQALARLPLRYRAPVILRDIEGLSYREIADALGCREGTVKSRINRGRERLKSLLEPYWRGGENA